MAPLSGVVLTGGKSRRMGTDKALITVAGQTILERTLAILSTLSNDVMVVGSRAEYHGLGVPVHEDMYPETGPLGGIATALFHAQHEHLLVVSCDLPFLNRNVLQAMAMLPRDYDVLAPRHFSEERRIQFEPLHAIYASTCRSAIVAQIEAGRLSLHAFLQHVRVRVPDVDLLHRYDPHGRSFMNVNTPEDLQEALRLDFDEKHDLEGSCFGT